MYLIAVWVFPASPELTRDRIAEAVDRHIPETDVAHVFRCERDEWLVVGIFLNGPSPADGTPDVERVRQALASVTPHAAATTILAELIPLEMLRYRTDLWDWGG
ncbi:hypothetical protein [Actinoplanes sp. N902-109]|uniref:hypothetical protein n=1 Tax=Actinoplanes sp. (strain N902-109) TaxID=649831 RepID=UPI000329361D|nr:hypothetical protein [Actinoplanes sp. N902-109]AGL13773.1 hypothetical protein L083_0263 [Actinoplanes sp. N902-109]